MQNSTLYVILSIIIIFLLLISVLIYSIFPILSVEGDSDKFNITFNNVRLVKWSASGGIFDIIYYDYICEQPVVVAYYDINFYDNNNVLNVDIVKPTLAVIYKVDELSIDTRSFSAIYDYVRTDLRTIQLLSENIYKAYLLPPSINPNLTTIDNPFYLTMYNEWNGKMPKFYEVDSIGFDCSVSVSPTAYQYFLNVFGQGYATSYINSENLFGGALFTFGTSLKTLRYPKFNWTYDSSTDLLTFFPALYEFGEDCVEYVFLLVSSFFYSFSPFYYLR